ncbi:hypothetical protein J2W21_001839 [Sinomonas atrocyanea]|nr:hypothetical protein [Sinomonas atrocyanea]
MVGTHRRIPVPAPSFVSNGGAEKWCNPQSLSPVLSTGRDRNCRGHAQGYPQGCRGTRTFSCRSRASTAASHDARERSTASLSGSLSRGRLNRAPRIGTGPCPGLFPAQPRSMIGVPLGRAPLQSLPCGENAGWSIDRRLFPAHRRRPRERPAASPVPAVHGLCDPNPLQLCPMRSEAPSSASSDGSPLDRGQTLRLHISCTHRTPDARPKTEHVSRETQCVRQSRRSISGGALGTCDAPQSTL